LGFYIFKHTALTLNQPVYTYLFQYEGTSCVIVTQNYRQKFESQRVSNSTESFVKIEKQIPIKITHCKLTEK